MHIFLDMATMTKDIFFPKPMEIATRTDVLRFIVLHLLRPLSVKTMKQLVHSSGELYSCSRRVKFFTVISFGIEFHSRGSTFTEQL